MKLINRVMNRIIYAVGDQVGKSWTKLSRGRKKAEDSPPSSSILSFLTVAKDLSKKVEPNSQLKAKVLDALYRANDNSRSYYLEDQSKHLFGRCLRLFFFY